MAIASYEAADFRNMQVSEDTIAHQCQGVSFAFARSDRHGILRENDILFAILGTSLTRRQHVILDFIFA